MYSRRAGHLLGQQGPFAAGKQGYRAATHLPSLDLVFANGATTLAEAETAGAGITYTGADNGTYFDLAGVLQTSASDTARFNHNPSTLAALGLLVEEARTNDCLQSEVLTTTWTIPGSNTTITDNAGVAPDGATTADDVEHDDNAETIQQTITVTDNTVVTVSAFVKQGTTGAHDFVKMSWMDESAGDNGFEAWFDISTGTVGTAQATGTGSYTSGSATITDVGSSWYRISAIGQIVSGQTDGRFEIINTTADAVDTAEETNSVFWWGLQVEEGAFLTSYIATTTAAVTRSADVPTVSDGTLFGRAEWTLYTRWSVPQRNTGVTWRIWQLDGGGSQAGFRNASGTMTVDGDTNLAISGLTSAADTVFESIMTSALNDAIRFDDGSQTGTDTAYTPIETFDRLSIGHSSTVSGREMNGHIERMAFYPVHLPQWRG